MKTKLVINIAILILLFISCKKKETKTEDPTPTPTPVTPPVYATFPSTIAVIDYTAVTNPTYGYLNNYNLTLTTTGMAYIIADGNRVDSLQLNITRQSSMATSTIAFSPTENTWYNTYILNSKDFKVKIGAVNSLNVFENGIKVCSNPIYVGGGPNYECSYEHFQVVNQPNTYAQVCADGRRFVVMH